MLPVFQTAAKQMWQKDNIHRWCSLVPSGLQVAQAGAQGIWYCIEEPDGEVSTQYLKDRTECFDDHFPCQKEDCDMQHVWNWLKMFLLYQNMAADRIRFIMFLTGGGA